MLKKLISTAILSSVIGSVSANPELGYMTLNTDRNHFFNATIAIDALPAELADKKLKVKLGSITDFYRHDIEYDKQVGSLRFKVTKDASGKPVIRVRSIREITAKQLQAVVKLYVGRQKIYGIYDFQVTPNKKEHHVSLNLLNSDHKPEEKQRYAKNTKSTATQSSEAIANSVTASREEAKPVDISSGLQYRVLAGKTISQIAMELLPEYPETSDWQALMEQLVSINPDAFVNGDINQLKSDAILNLPARENLQTISEVSAQPLAREVEPKADELVAKKQSTPDQNDLIQRSQEEKAELTVPKVLAQEDKPSLDFTKPKDGDLTRKEEPETPQHPEPVVSHKDVDTEADGNKRYLVSKGETISLIAIKLSPQYSGMENWRGLMDELITLNPDAFIDGDVNQLRAEVELKLPAPSQTAIVSDLSRDSTLETQPLLSKVENIKPQPDRQDISEETPQLTEVDNAAIKIQPTPVSQEQTGGTYQVLKGETIGSIAIKLQSDYPGVSNWKSLMDQLVMLNPDAFINGDINQIRAGTSLVLPFENASSHQRPIDPQKLISEGENSIVTLPVESIEEQVAETQGSLDSMNPDDTYQVVAGDSISGIAMKLQERYPNANDWQEVMAQLVALNPDAFIDGDSSKLRADAVLDLHSQKITEVEAVNKETPEVEASVSRHEEDLILTPAMESDSNIYQVENGETISAIAMKLKTDYPDVVRWQTVMGRLVELNPEAFIDGDVNRLLSNALLILPAQGDFEVEAENQELPEDTLSAVDEKPSRTSDESVSHVEVTHSAEKGDQYQVSQGESASTIAIKLAPDYPGVDSWKAIMEQLVILNPEAFIDGDADKLRSDAVLALPSKEHLSSNIEAENHEQSLTPDYTMDGESQAETYKVSKGESLRSISLQLLSQYPKGSSVKAIMDRLVALNPEAFINGDPGRLLAESTLSLPSQDDFEIENLSTVSTTADLVPEKGYRVSQGDSLRSISIRLFPNYPNAGRVETVMDRLVELNPDAFIGGDANRLLAESTLVLPAESDFQQESVSDNDNSKINETLTQLNKQDYGYSRTENTYRVAKGENLRAIATELLVNYPNISQVEPVMEQLVALNPEAFIDGDARKLLAESTLKLPLQNELINQSVTQEDSSDINASMAKLSKESPENQYQVSAGESISAIAMKLLPNYPQTQDWKTVMNSLILLNPGAFIGGDESKLRSDAVLMIPGQDDLEIEAENQEIPGTPLPDSSFNNLEEGPDINLTLADVQDDSQPTAKKKVK